MKSWRGTFTLKKVKRIKVLQTASRLFHQTQSLKIKKCRHEQLKCDTTPTGRKRRNIKSELRRSSWFYSSAQMCSWIFKHLQCLSSNMTQDNNQQNLSNNDKRWIWNILNIWGSFIFVFMDFPPSVNLHVVFVGSVVDKSKQKNHFLVSFLNICWYSRSCRASSDIKTVTVWLFEVFDYQSSVTSAHDRTPAAGTPGVFVLLMCLLWFFTFLVFRKPKSFLSQFSSDFGNNKRRERRRWFRKVNRKFNKNTVVNLFIWLKSAGCKTRTTLQLRRKE